MFASATAREDSRLKLLLQGESESCEDRSPITDEDDWLQVYSRLHGPPLELTPRSSPLGTRP
jgi:hypothetical protein